MHLRAHAVILAARAHGEHGSVVRAFTREDGVQPGYVRGGRSRAMRPVLLAANVIQGEWRARTGDQLAALTAELIHSRATLHGEPLAAGALEWATALAAVALANTALLDSAERLDDDTRRELADGVVSELRRISTLLAPGADVAALPVPRRPVAGNDRAGVA